MKRVIVKRNEKEEEKKEEKIREEGYEKVIMKLRRKVEI